MILIMKWLAKYDAVMDCFVKTVTVKKSRDLKFSFQGKRKTWSPCIILVRTEIITEMISCLLCLCE